MCTYSKLRGHPEFLAPKSTLHCVPDWKQTMLQIKCECVPTNRRRQTQIEMDRNVSLGSLNWGREVFVQVETSSESQVKANHAQAGLCPTACDFLSDEMVKVTAREMSAVYFWPVELYKDFTKRKFTKKVVLVAKHDTRADSLFQILMLCFYR